MNLREFIKIVAPELQNEWGPDKSFDDAIGDYYDYCNYRIGEQIFGIERWVHDEEAGFSFTFFDEWEKDGELVVCGDQQADLVMKFKRLPNDQLDYHETQRSNLILEMISDATDRDVSPYPKYHILNTLSDFSGNEQQSQI